MNAEFPWLDVVCDSKGDEAKLFEAIRHLLLIGVCDRYQSLGKARHIAEIALPTRSETDYARKSIRNLPLTCFDVPRCR